METTNQQKQNAFTFAHTEDNGRSQTGEHPWREPEDPAMLTPEQKQRVLDERAQALAHDQEQVDSQEEMLRVVEFSLAHDRYAVEATFVREVQHVAHLTPLPCTPSFVIGIINIRGRILSVIDLRAFFDLPPDSLYEPDTVVVLRSETLEVGVFANGAVDARSIPLRSIKSVSPGLAGIRREYLRGVSEEHAILLDVERILSDSRMLVGADEVEL